jgi:tRNA G18 (ribose-2'-O)-methylase SpoU
MVTDRYQHIEYHETVGEFVRWASDRGLPLVGVDICSGSLPIEKYSMPDQCVLVLGQEGPGLSDEMIVACTDVLHISQYGSTRSINVGVASGIAMHSWLVQHVV